MVVMFMMLLRIAVGSLSVISARIGISDRSPNPVFHYFAQMNLANIQKDTEDFME